MRAPASIAAWVLQPEWDKLHSRCEKVPIRAIFCNLDLTLSHSDRQPPPAGKHRWLRTPCGLRPAPSAQTTSSARGLGGWSRWRGPAVSPAQTDLRSPVVCGLLTFAPWLLTLLAYLAIPTHPGCPQLLPHPPSRPYPTLILGSAMNLPGCKRLHLSFGPSWVARWSGRVKTQIVRPGRRGGGVS